MALTSDCAFNVRAVLAKLQDWLSTILKFIGTTLGISGGSVLKKTRELSLKKNRLKELFNCVLEVFICIVETKRWRPFVETEGWT